MIAELTGKGKYIRTVPLATWTKRAVDEWADAAKIDQGALFRRVGRPGKLWGEGLTLRLSGPSSKRLRNVLALRISLRMTSAVPELFSMQAER